MFKYIVQRILLKSNQSKFITSKGGSLVRAFSVVSNKQLSSKGYQQLFAFTIALYCVTYQCVQSSPAYNFWDTVNIANVKKDIIEAIDTEDESRGDGTGIGPTLVRLAWHASGTYSIHDKTGGSNGATMRMEPENKWGANAGLKLAREFLEPIKKKYPSLSYADLWTLAGVCAIENAGGPQISWQKGRTDSPKPTIVPDGRLPAADKGSVSATNQGTRETFYRMGFNDREIVALSGAHALGRCHTDASGYWGPWTRAETTFSNEYFRLLLSEKWTVKKTHEGNKPWKGPMQYENKDGTLMMLPSDLALIQDPEFKKFVEIYAADEKVFFTDFAAAFSKLLELGWKQF